jgi:hypothetical protein
MHKGWFRTAGLFELRTFPASNDEQDDSSHQRQPAEYGWNRNSLLLFCGGVDGPDVKNLFLMGVIESLIGEDQPAQNN